MTRMKRAMWIYLICKDRMLRLPARKSAAWKRSAESLVLIRISEKYVFRKALNIMSFVYIVVVVKTEKVFQGFLKFLLYMFCFVVRYITIHEKITIVLVGKQESAYLNVFTW